MLAGFTREDADVKGEEAEELCCFDRMKKLIAKREVSAEGSTKDQISSIIIEQKINQMECQLSKKVSSKISTPKMQHHRTASATNFYKKGTA